MDSDSSVNQEAAIKIRYGRFVIARAGLNSPQNVVPARSSPPRSATGRATSENKQKSHFFEQFELLRNIFFINMKSLKIMHPQYGLVPKVLEANNVTTTKKAMQDYLKDADGSYMEKAEDEARNALKLFPRHGIVTFVVAFETYVRNSLEVFANLLIENCSLEDFIGLCGKDTVYKRVFKGILEDLVRKNPDSENFVESWGIESCDSLSEFRKAWKLIPPSLRCDKTAETNNRVAHEASLLFDEFMKKASASGIKKLFKKFASSKLEHLLNPTLTAVIETLTGIFLGKSDIKTDLERAFDACIKCDKEISCVYFVWDGDYLTTVRRNRSRQPVGATIASRIHFIRLDDEDIEHMFNATTPGINEIHFQIADDPFCFPLSETDLTEIKAQYGYWEGFWLFDEQEFEIKVKPADWKAVNNLSTLFFGLHCILSHGNKDKGVLGSKPSRIPLEVIKKRKRVSEEYFILTADEKRQIAKEKEEYLLNLWKKVEDERDKVQVDYWLCSTCEHFLFWYAKCLERTLSCILHKLGIHPQETTSWSSLTHQQREKICENLNFKHLRPTSPEEH